MRRVDADEAIRILDQLIAAREKSCTRSAIIEAQAFRMAAEVIRQLPGADNESHEAE